MNGAIDFDRVIIGNREDGDGWSIYTTEGLEEQMLEIVRLARLGHEWEALASMAVVPFQRMKRQIEIAKEERDEARGEADQIHTHLDVAKVELSHARQELANLRAELSRGFL